MSSFDTPITTRTGANSFLMKFGDEIDRGLSIRIAHFVKDISEESGFGIVSAIPSYTTLGVTVDPGRRSILTVINDLSTNWQQFLSQFSGEPSHGRVVTIPMVYGGKMGPDITDVARIVEMTESEVIERHAQAEYLVAAVGFAAGFSFLHGLPRELRAPRRSSPRTKVPAGSLGIGGLQTGVYPVDSPGGWNLIGRTPWRLFDPFGSADAVLEVGDFVRFRPISEAEFEDHKRDNYVEVPSCSLSRDMEIEDAGLQASVQDLGRPDQGGLGVAPSGAMDKSALVSGNRLLGNPDNCAGIEWAILPPSVKFNRPSRIVVTGADPGWMLDDSPLRIGEVVTASIGSQLRAIQVAETIGARGYLCVQGGIDAPLVLGSRALDDVAQFGGAVNRYLRRGDCLAYGKDVVTQSELEIGHKALTQPSPPDSRPFRVIPGPQADQFSPEVWDALVSDTFVVDSKSDRVGARLNGPLLKPEPDLDVISEPNVTGAIQVTSSGQPIILLPGRATIGGYAKIALVIESDHDRLGQLKPGDKLQFQEVEIEEAEHAFELQRLTPIGGLSPSRLGGDTGNLGQDIMTKNSEKYQSWQLDDIEQLFEIARNAGITSFALESSDANLSFTMGHTVESAVYSQRKPEHNTNTVQVLEQNNRQHYVTAPLIGTFYCRSEPELPPFCEIGDRVDAETTVGLIEIMKTYHEVRAGVDGVVSEILVDDGATVEYGQELVRIAKDVSR